MQTVVTDLAEHFKGFEIQQQLLDSFQEKIKAVEKLVAKNKKDDH